MKQISIYHKTKLQHFLPYFLIVLSDEPEY